ncbi:MAG TPA: GH3 auxin-responsive promoter family protein [Pyrinomonadaceae bacterium]|nr:GH3 auxin-responsive promoter family protein [Pyrinomonadaceae bacterium]
MRGLANDYLRTVISSSINTLGLIATGSLKLRLLRFTRNQERLKRKYGITRETPILSYGPELVQSIHAAAIRRGDRAIYAKTSGSTGKAKEILYTSKRLRALKLTFSDMFMRACYAFTIKRTSLYVFSSFKADTSLTSLLLDESELPNYLSTLQAPYRVQHHSAIQTLVARYGPAAVRLWILAISNPGVLYSTNPSTISTFLDTLKSDWQRSSQLIRDWINNRAKFSADLHKVAQRIESRACDQRLEQIATSDVSLPLSVCAPAVEAYVCWTGGYLKPFLDRLTEHLPACRYKLIPMYSMSTETIETLACFRAQDVAFLPIGEGVVYEFIEENAMDHPDNLLGADQLEPGKLYTMVVSDDYGLRRYQTDDLFLCRRKINTFPDLIFMRRRSLQYSFTGEKLTAEQLSVAFERLRALYPSAMRDKILTCIPSQDLRALPHYRLLLIGDRTTTVANSYDFLAARCDELLCDMNHEYKSKRVSGRLGRIEVETIEFHDFVGAKPNWETQFKPLPLQININPVLI